MKKDKFAVIKLGGSQHLVKVGDTIEVNRLDVEENKSVDISDVLLVQDGEKIEVGTPLVSKAKVSYKVLEHKRGDKVTKSTYTAKSRYRRKVGHRQPLTKIEITKIS